MKLVPFPLIAALFVLAGCAASEEPITRAPVTTASAPAIASKAPLLTDTIVVPGERVGPITRTTTREDLALLFGEERLSDEPIGIGEGETESGTVVNLGPEKSFSVIWEDSDRTRPADIRNLGPAWQTPEGIGVDVSFNQLKRILGSFRLFGFEWDYGGTLVLTDSQLAQYSSKLIVSVAASQEAIRDNQTAYFEFMSDNLYPSDAPNLDLFDIKVEEMIVYLNRELPDDSVLYSGPSTALHFWAGSEVETDPRVIEVYEHHACSGQVAVARVTSMPEHSDAVLQPELALELSPSGSVIRQWTFPIDVSVIGVEGDRLIVPKGTETALSIVDSGQFEEVARPEKDELGEWVSCPEISIFGDSAYLRCFEFKDLASGKTRLIAYNAPCT